MESGFEQPAAASVQVPESNSAWFASSEVAYLADRLAVGNVTTGEPWRISRLEFDYDEGAAKTQWIRDIRFRGFNGRMTLSPDGAWLALGAWTLRVLDAATGRSAFEFPIADREAAHARLGTVLKPGDSVADIGSVGGERFLGENLLIFRHIGISSCGPSGSSGYRECVAKLRREHGEGGVVDVFDMRTVALDSEPDFRVEVGPDIPCGEGDFPLRGLQVHDGELTFLTTRR